MHMISRALLVLTTLAVAGSTARAQDAFKVVVNSANSTTALSNEEVSKLFLKKETKWQDGVTVDPVDQGASSATRAAFSKAVLSRPVGAVDSYWQQQIFAGRGSPPPQKANDAAVLAYVAEHPGAIGYVSSGASAPGTKTVSLRP